MDDKGLPELSSTFNTHVFDGAAQFMIFRPCYFCRGRGIKSSAASQDIYDNSKVHDDLKCSECQGRGGKTEYVSLGEVYEILRPALMKELIDKLPDVILNTKVELVRQIMES